MEFTEIEKVEEISKHLTNQKIKHKNLNLGYLERSI